MPEKKIPRTYDLQNNNEQNCFIQWLAKYVLASHSDKLAAKVKTRAISVKLRLLKKLVSTQHYLISSFEQKRVQEKLTNFIFFTFPCTLKKKCFHFPFDTTDISVIFLLIQLDIVGREETRLAVVVAKPPILIWEFL